MAVSFQLFVILTTVFFMMALLPEQYIWKIILFFLLFVPNEAQGIISGTPYITAGVLNLSMVGYVSIIASIILLIRYKTVSKKALGFLSMFFVIILSVRIIADGTNFISNKLFDNYFIPMFLALVIISHLKVEYIPTLLKFMYISVLIGAVIACIEYLYGQSLFLHYYYNETCPWYIHIYRSSKYVVFRSTSLFGHPLIGSIYYLMGVVYLLYSKEGKGRKLLVLIQLMILVAAILTTNSRSAILGLLIVIGSFLYSNKMIGRFIFLFVLVIVLGMFFDLREIYNIIFARDNTGSSYMVRVRAVLSLKDIPLRTIMLGEGYNNTYNLLQKLGFRGNVEISYLIILIENGIIGFFSWIASMLYLYRKKMSSIYYRGIKVASTLNGMLLCIFLVGGMSNSFGDPGTLNYTIYILLSFTYVFSRLKSDREELLESGTIELSKIRFVLSK